jgi:hypothetical protein
MNRAAVEAGVYLQYGEARRRRCPLTGAQAAPAPVVSEELVRG